MAETKKKTTNTKKNSAKAKSDTTSKNKGNVKKKTTGTKTNNTISTKANTTKTNNTKTNTAKTNNTNTIKKMATTKPTSKKSEVKVEPKETVVLKEDAKDNLKPTENNTKKVKEKKSNNIIKYVMYVIILVLLGVLSFSTYKIISWQIDNNKTQDLIKDIEEDVKIKEGDGENAEIIIPDEFSEDNLKYLAMKLIDVDLSGIKKENKDVVGWVQVKGTKVNYPFVQTNNNSYYLNHSIDKSINEAGWIFLDYRNKLGEDKNTILYGHGRLNKTMFGSLNDILENGWTENKDNFIIRMSTEKENSLWQIISAYHINTTNDYTHINFNSNEDFVKFANKMIKRSMYDFNGSVNEDDVMLTLSTCYNNDEKMVIHAKLIKKEAKNIDSKTDDKK